MASRAALAIENSALYEDLERSRKDIETALNREKHYTMLLQRALIPPKPAGETEYEVASVYIPSRIGGEIGGDFYDLFRTQDQRLAILIGDVSGKGLRRHGLLPTAPRFTPLHMSILLQVVR